MTSGESENLINILFLFIHLAGYVIGLGAVTVIDLHGFLGRKSEYWTEATTRTHKVTKPLIWFGTMMATLGGLVFFGRTSFTDLNIFQLFLSVLLILNGLFLTFSVSRFLLKKEKEGLASQILSNEWQLKIMVSFIFSFIGWWGSFIITVVSLYSLGRI